MKINCITFKNATGERWRGKTMSHATNLPRLHICRKVLPAAGEWHSQTRLLQPFGLTRLSGTGTKREICFTASCNKRNWKSIWDGSIKVLLVLALKKQKRPRCAADGAQWKRLSCACLSYYFSIIVAFASPVLSMCQALC